MKKITPEMVRGAFEDDLGLSPEEVARRLENGIEISYGKLTMRAEAHAMDEARREVAAIDPSKRFIAMNSVKLALDRNLKKILKGKANKKVNDEFHQDLLIWQALKEHAS